MAFPTATITQGSGLTINTLPNAGQATMANSLSVAIASDQSGVSVTSFSAGSITNPASTVTRPANTAAYAANQLIASSTAAAAVVVPSFMTPYGAGIISRLRLKTNAATGWGGVTISINLWSAAPTYANGDGGAYAVATGSDSWLANFLLTLTQLGDGAVAAAQVTTASEMAFRLLSGISVYWDMQIQGAATPVSGQTFKLTAEVLN